MKPFKGPPVGVACMSCPYSQKDLAVDPRGPYECHLNPPVFPANHWPTVDGGDWCSHHPHMLLHMRIRKEVYHE
jgi:hypothetical protein